MYAGRLVVESNAFAVGNHLAVAEPCDFRLWICVIEKESGLFGSELGGNWKVHYTAGDYDGPLKRLCLLDLFADETLREVGRNRSG